MIKNVSISLLVFFISIPGLFARGDIRLQDGIKSYNVSLDLSFYRDTGKKLTIDDVKQRDFQKNFILNDDPYAAFGVNRANQWGKFEWSNQNSAEKQWFIIFDTSKLEKVDLYVIDSRGKIKQSFHHDSWNQFSGREIKSRKIIFPLEPPEGNETIYFNARTGWIMELRTFLVTAEELARSNYINMFELGLYYGLIIIMFLYNLFIFLATRDRSYLYYIIFIGSFSTAQAGLDGVLHEFVFPESFEFSRQFRNYIASLAFLANLVFAPSFMRIKDYYPGLAKIFRWLIPFALLPAFFQLSGIFHYALLSKLLLMFIFPIIQLIAGAVLFFKNIYAKFYFFAWVFFLTGIFIHSLKAQGVYFFLSDIYTMKVGHAFEVTILSLGLGYRIRDLQRSYFEKTSELLQARLANLKDKMKPHFVLNTIAIISSYLTFEPKKAEKALDRLADAYHFLLREGGRHLISLEKEVGFTRDYIDLLLLKHADILQIEYKEEGPVGQVQIPTLTLQPIVENAYKHGVRKLKTGRIDVTVKTDGKHTELLVINSSDGKPLGDLFNGTLGSIKRRLEYFFPESSLTVSSKNNETMVRIVYNFDENHLRRVSHGELTDTLG